MYYFNPLDVTCKSITGAIPRMSDVTLQIVNQKSGEGDFSAQTCLLVISKDGEAEQRLAMKATQNGFAISLRFHQRGLYFYRFELDGRGFGLGKMRKGEFSDFPASWQITVYEPEYKTPDWLKGGVMYQIFPDRFCKSGEISALEHKILRSDWGGTPRYLPNEYGKVLNNDFFGGNLNGIRKKLPYLKELGVTALYLNPIFEAYSNHRYDTGDYLKIDPLLGTLDDFDALLDEAKQCGIGIILDGVFNHTGDDSRYFNRYGRYHEVGAYQSKHSPYADWYRFREFPESYDSWWGIATLPAVNENSESYQNFILGSDGVLKYWLKRGIRGWRLDVADELPDFFLEMLRTSVKDENSDAVIIGEVWEDASNKIAYSERRHYLQGLELDSVMNYPLKDAIINYLQTGNTAFLRETVLQLIDNYPKQTLDTLMNILGTHDTARILTVLGGQNIESRDEMAVARLSEADKNIAKAKLKMASVLQFTLPGVPCIYYGDEIGMEGYRDPFCRRCFDWEGADGDLLRHYIELSEVRQGSLNQVFAEGSYREVYADATCLVFERKYGDACVYVYVNNSPSKYSINFVGEYLEHLTGECYTDHVPIAPFSYGILQKL